MSAFSAAASDEDGDIISALREKLGRAHALCRIRLDRIRELEAMLYAVGAGGVGKVEQPKVEQEPVAWILRDANNHNVKFLEWTSTPTGYRGEWIKTPLYTQPRQPLPDEQIEALWRKLVGTPRPNYSFARAIERAHKIGGEA